MAKKNVARPAKGRRPDPLTAPFRHEEKFQEAFEQLSGSSATTSNAVDESNPRHVLTATGDETKTIRRRDYPGEAVLTSGQAQLFDELMKNWPDFVTAKHLANEIWGSDDKAVVHTCKKRLAEALKSVGVEIESDRRGYRLRMI